MTPGERDARLAALCQEPRVPEDTNPKHLDINCVAGLIAMLRDAASDSDRDGQPIRTVLEVGSNLGVSTEVFLLLFEQIWVVDPWSDETGAERYAAFLRRTASYPGLRSVLRAHSPEAAREFADESFDLVYIDADHRYEQARADIAAFWPKVKRGGWIAGHDYSRAEANFGVIEAVTELISPLPRVYPDTSWMYRKAS